MFDSAKEWARARMAPTTWDRLSRASRRGARTFSQVNLRVDQAVAGASARFPATGTPSYPIWRAAMACIVVLVPSLVLALADHHGLDIPALFLLLAVGLSVYLSDWIGGVISIAVSVIALQLFFVGDALRLETELTGGEIGTMLTFVIVAGICVNTTDRLLTERTTAKLEATAMRAANTALSAVEIAAASRPAGDNLAFIGVMESIVAAMVRVNRASAGALYLIDAADDTLVRIATYGELETPDDFLPSTDEISAGTGFAGRVVRERRSLILDDVLAEENTEDILSTNPHVRSVAGVPLIDPNDRVVGVAWVGLYVPYRFSATTIARLQSLGHRTVAFMESARLADMQEEMLDRAQDNQRRLQSVIQTMPEAMMVVRPPSGVIVASNAAAQRMFDIRPERQMRPRQFDQLRVRFSSGPNDQEMPIVRAMIDGEIVTGVELMVTLPDGTKVPVVASAAPLYTEDGQIDAVVGVFQDVRPLKEAERLRDEFISVVSHELRSPLTPIRGFAQVVARELTKEGGHDQQVAWLTTLQLQVDRMTRLVDDLLDVSRLRAGRLQIRQTETDLVAIARSVVDTRKSTTEHHTITLQSEVDHLNAYLDGDRIYQVIDNLVGNAIKYTQDTTIAVALEQSSSSAPIHIVVSDNGPGIPEPERDQLFTPFYRARSAAESAVPGLGLGLYICQELVQAHGGEISVDESAEGGTQFTITLPPNARILPRPTGFV